MPDEEPKEALTKYGMLRETFLKEHHRVLYAEMLLSDKLKVHCLVIHKKAETRADTIIKSLMESEGVTEKLKVKDEME